MWMTTHNLLAKNKQQTKKNKKNNIWTKWDSKDRGITWRKQTDTLKLKNTVTEIKSLL